MFRDIVFAYHLCVIWLEAGLVAVLYVCSCDAGWTGETCAAIKFGPALPCGSGGLCLDSKLQFTSTWGGEAAQAQDGTWHLFAAGFAHNQPLAAWLTDSRVLHATSSSSVGGPYTLDEVVSLGDAPGAFDSLTQHNPVRVCTCMSA